MTENNNQVGTPFAELFDSLPPHYFEDFSENFLLLLAALRLHGFTILRADEGTNHSSSGLWAELSHPSVWICAASAPKATNGLRQLKKNTPEYSLYTDKVIRSNLLEQERLLLLLSEFYEKRTTPFYARIIAETVELGETYVRCQGSSVRLILKDDALKKQWLHDADAEMLAFATFLVKKKPT